jgi:hypothetical protein
LPKEADIQRRVMESQNLTGQGVLQAPDEGMKTFWTNSAWLNIYSNQDWSGVVLDSQGDSETIDRSSHDAISEDGVEGLKIFECPTGGVYSVSFQKGTDQGYLDLVIIRAGEIIDEGSTTADYGIVSLSGRC